MIESENSPDKYKTWKISIRQIIKNPEMVKFVPDHFKTKKVCKNVIKKLSFVIMINMRLKKCAVNLF